LEGDRGLQRDWEFLWRRRGEGVGAMVEHLLGEVGTVDVCLDAKIAEHGVRFPPTEELDDIRVDVGAEEGGGTTRAETAGRHESVVNAGGFLEGHSAPFEAVTDPGGGDGFQLATLVVEVVEWSLRRSVVAAEFGSDAEECFAGAEERVVGNALGYRFAFDPVLLVSEGESSRGDCSYLHVIQRRVSGDVHLLGAEREANVAEAKGLRAAFGSALGVLGGAEEPVEGDDSEVDDALVGETCAGVVGVQDVEQIADDDDVGGVGSAWRVVILAEGVEERTE